MLDTVLSLMALAFVALVLGAIALFRRGGATRQAVLMLVLAAIIAGNVAIWTLPDQAGKTLAAEAPH